MFHPYLCRREGVQTRNDRTCFAPFSTRLKGDAETLRHHQCTHVEDRMGHAVRLSQKPIIDAVIGKSDPAEFKGMPVLSASPAISATPLPCAATSVRGAETG